MKSIKTHLNHYLAIKRTFIKQNSIWTLTQYLNINFVHKLPFFFFQKKVQIKRGKEVTEVTKVNCIKAAVTSWCHKKLQVK